MTPPVRDEHRDDAELVAAARAGDTGALETLLRRHHDRILVLCRRLCADRSDADDAAQLALIAIVRGLPRFDGRAAFSTWSYRIATNTCIDELRRRSRRPVPVDLEDPVAGSDGFASAPASGPEEAVVGAERRGTLQRALDELPEEFRLPVVLRDLVELDYAEIAELLGLPPGTVRSRIARGRSKLAVLLRGSDLAPGNRDGTGDVTVEDTP